MISSLAPKLKFYAARGILSCSLRKEELNEPQLLFIVGTGRSGTNLCKALLDVRPDICIGTETHFIPKLIATQTSNEFELGRFIDVLMNHWDSDGSYRWFEHHVLRAGRQPKKFRSDFERFCFKNDFLSVGECIYAFYIYCYGKHWSFIGDKTPQYGMHMADIHRILPKAKFLHLVRDGRYCATSIQKHGGFIKMINGGYPEKTMEYAYDNQQSKYPTEPLTLSQCIGFWQHVVLRIEEQAALIPKENYLRVRYEDLQMDSSRELTRIGAFLQLSKSELWTRVGPWILDRGLRRKQEKRLENKDFDELTEAGSKALKLLNYI
ncbi:sulfotransferase family protein [Cerasicoccus fimbriatus]|uniref:sulfotransferase family protein n=1 Tax=Cerasicoccus fimbriatus TaxID=3014554 RepID=UPI0022B5D67E|nr:sulfotransferase [Cerasicoccus sp. TK19100]